tara:strand:+ start:926 stop:1177 length:252 start_codon:yes stop_codon:yes gene_type:complete
MGNSKKGSARSVGEIARDVRESWSNVNYAAQPYLEAMLQDDGSGMYFYDTMKSVVLYFLSNATRWRGDDARRLKAELKKAVQA